MGLADSYIGLILVHAALGRALCADHRAGHAGKGSTTTWCAPRSAWVPTPLRTFFRVTLAGDCAGRDFRGALFAFATSFDEVVVTLFLAGAEQTR